MQQGNCRASQRFWIAIYPTVKRMTRDNREEGEARKREDKQKEKKEQKEKGRVSKRGKYRRKCIDNYFRIIDGP